MNTKSLEPGDIVWGTLPCSDGRGFARHAGLVIGAISGEPVAIVGTSQDVPPRSGAGQLVLAPIGKESLDSDWRLTQLAKPTRFDGQGQLFRVSDARDVVLCGTIREVRCGTGRREWLTALKDVKNVAIATLIDRMRSIERFAKAA